MSAEGEGVRAPEPESPHDLELRAAGQLASPTWELELFLSGAFVFATMQLPGAIDGLTARLEPHAVGGSRQVLLSAALYSKSIAFTLIATFLLHLIGRGQWVALMGLRSVYPGGIRWDELRLGPIARRVYERGTPDLGTSIARLDNFCSVVFSTGLLFVVLFSFSAALLGVFGAVAWGLSRGLFGGQYHSAIAFTLMGLFALVPIGGSLVDRKWGPRMAPESPGYRWLSRIIAFSQRITMVHTLGPVMWTLISNVGRMRGAIFMYATLVVVIGLALADFLVRRDRLSFNSYEYHATTGSLSVNPRYYETQRGDNPADARLPMIQADIIRDPYVRLFIPYSPSRHNAAIPRACPELRPLQSRGLQAGADDIVADSLAQPVLECLARIHAVTMDGAARPDLVFAFTEHPGTGLLGMVAYIPVDSLTRGRHVITVLPVPPAELPTDSAALANAMWKQPYVIPFWR